MSIENSRAIEFFKQVSDKLKTKGTNNSIKTLEIFKKIFLSFEQQENKNLYLLLNSIRKEFGYNQEFNNIPDAKKVYLSIQKLSESFEELLQEENFEEYVRKAGIIWYRFIKANPYLDNNGITARCLLAVMLAHKDYIIRPMFTSKEKQIDFMNRLKETEINEGNLEKVGYIILDKIRDVGVDFSDKKRLPKKNSRQSDVWAVNKNITDLSSPLRTILERKDKIIEPLKIFTNCSSKFIINGKEIERHIGTVIFSKKIDLSFCIMDNGKYGDAVSETIDFFNEFDIPYEVISGDDISEKKVDNDIPETWFIRELYVFIESLNNSRDNGCEECIVYPDVKSRLMVGYYTDDNNFHEVWGLHFKGLITTSNSWSLIINEKDYRNISVEEAIKTIVEKGFSYKVGSDPFEEVRKK